MSDGRKFSPLNGLAQASRAGRNDPPPVESGAMIVASRTLMKSQPELAELVKELDGLEVSMSEKGLGTRVSIRAAADSGLSEADLERFLDGLAEPQKQPFGSA